MFFRLALFSTFLSVVNAQRTFVWAGSRVFSDASNYANGRLPCEDDNILTDQNETLVMLLNGSMKVSSLYLPDNGILYIDDTYAALGERAEWQCEKADFPADSQVLIEDPPFFHDAANWEIHDYNGEINRRPDLDAAKVPGQLDTVIFPTNRAERIRLEYTANMRVLKFGNRSLDSHSIYEHLLTLEGQLQFLLSENLEATIEVGEVKLRWPNGQVFAVRDVLIPPGGQPLVNAKPPHFEGVCNYVHCIDLEDFCVSPVMPEGNCCPICGAMATFSTLAIIPSEPQMFDEEEYVQAMADAFTTIEQVIGEHQIFNVDRSFSVEYKIHFGKVLQNLLLFALLCVVLAGLFAFEYRRNARLRVWIADRRSTAPTIPVVFRRGVEAVEVWRTRRSSRNADESQAFEPPTFEAEFSNAAFGKERDTGSHLSFSSLLSTPSTAEEKPKDDAAE
ncbi:hypothetical protein M3Y99_01797300 [Aphelenchoides fujianensis]|nr:hypothetical protein M3Y99_01797300 [Aphelenchoides fujianensis]